MMTDISQIKGLTDALKQIGERLGKLEGDIKQSGVSGQSGTKTLDITLEAAKWNQTDKTYLIENELVRENSVVIMTLKVGTSPEAAKAYQLADIYCEAQQEGSVKIVCYGTLPTIDIETKLVII